MSGEIGSYLMRSLISEGRIRYETVEQSGKSWVGRVIEKEGPTGLLTTTTGSLHPENETRMLSLTVSDTPEQTRHILVSQARGRNRNPSNYATWHELDAFIVSNKSDVFIPYAEKLAHLIPTVAIRLRRDFATILVLIRVHARLHQQARAKDEMGQVIAELADYCAIRPLVADIIAEGIEDAVTPTMREIVEMVRAQHNAVSITELSKLLKIDKSSASRRVGKAVGRGYLRFLHAGRGVPSQVTTGDPLPDDLEILPLPERLG
jgi:hypothetical protein